MGVAVTVSVTVPETTAFTGEVSENVHVPPAPAVVVTLIGGRTLENDVPRLVPAVSAGGNETGVLGAVQSPAGDDATLTAAEEVTPPSPLTKPRLLPNPGWFGPLSLAAIGRSIVPPAGILATAPDNDSPGASKSLVRC